MQKPEGGLAMFIETSKGNVFCTIEGEGHPVILVHGFGCSSAQWRYTTEALVKANLQVVALDLPGFGQSYLPDKPVTAASFRHTLIDVMDSLGLDSAALVGSSMGGLVSWLVAANAPERVKALALVSPAGAPPLDAVRQPRRKSPYRRFGSTTALALFAALARQSLFDPFTRRLLYPSFERLFGEVPVPAEVRELLFQEAKKSRIVFTQRLTPAELDNAGHQLQGISCPTLLMWGDQDNIIPLQAMDFFVEHMPESVIKVYLGVGHLPMLEIPEEFSTDVSRFLLASFARRPAQGIVEQRVAGNTVKDE